MLFDPYGCLQGFAERHQQRGQHSVFYDKFVEDVAKLESANGVLSPNSQLRNDIVTFISENYTPREAGHMVRYAQHVSLRLQTFCPSASDATVRW